MNNEEWKVSLYRYYVITLYRYIAISIFRDSVNPVPDQGFTASA